MNPTGVDLGEDASTASNGGEELDISVIIVSWNARRYLEECLSSLRTGVARPYEVIVVDNASTDGSPGMVMELFPWVKLIQSEENLGFAGGNNLGFRHARGRYLCLVNSDVNVFAGCLDGLASYLDLHRDVGMVGPRILNSDKSLQNTCRAFPSLWNKFCVVSGLSRLVPRSRWFSGEEMLWFDHLHERHVDALVGCFVMARADAIRDFGPLSDEFFMYGEDIDWGRRCWKAGWKVVFIPTISSIHYGGASSSNAPMRFALEAQRASLQLWAKHRSYLECLAFRGLLAIHCFLRIFRQVVMAVIACEWPANHQAIVRVQVACLAELLWPFKGRPTNGPCRGR